MYTQPVSIVFKPFHTQNYVNQKQNNDEPCELVSSFCKTFVLPDEKINHAQFDEKLAAQIASYKEKAVNPVLNMLKNAKKETDITAGLFLLNRIIDAGAQNVGNTYPVISRFNYSDSANVQSMLSGIYRKTLVPDAFGPLMTMFLKNSEHPKQIPFDPNEEIGGAILEYLRNNQKACNNFQEELKTKAALSSYSK